MRARWTQIVDPYGIWETPEDFVPQAIHHEGEVVGTVSKWGTSYVLIATDDGQIHEVRASHVTMLVTR